MELFNSPLLKKSSTQHLIPHRATICPKIIRRLKDKNVSNESSATNFSSSISINPAFSQSNLRRSSFSFNWKKTITSITEKTESHLPSGLDTFRVLLAIKTKNPYFTIPITNSVIFTSNSMNSTIFDSENVLRVIENCESVQAVKYIKSIFPGFSPEKTSPVPLFILKHKNYNSLAFSIPDAVSAAKDGNSDLVIQRFIMPRGLRVCKYRVIINKFQKVMVMSSKKRTDLKSDCKRVSLSMDSLQHEKTTQVKQTQINPANGFITATIGSIKRIKKLGELSKVDKEEKSIFGMLKVAVNTVKNSHDRRELDRFFVSNNEEKTEFFVGKNQSFAEIIKITEQLWAQIDYFFLESSKLTELACEFLQDKLGRWYFIHIVHGTTEPKEKPKKKTLKKIHHRETILIKSYSLSTK